MDIDYGKEKAKRKRDPNPNLIVKLKAEGQFLRVRMA